MRELTYLVMLAFACAGVGCARIESVALPDGKKRSPVTCEVAARGTLVVSGRLCVPGAADWNRKAGILLVRYLAKDGKTIPSKDLDFTSIFKCGYKYLAAGPTVEPFSFSFWFRTAPYVRRFLLRDSAVRKMCSCPNSSMDLRHLKIGVVGGCRSCRSGSFCS